MVAVSSMVSRVVLKKFKLTYPYTYAQHQKDLSVQNTDDGETVSEYVIV